MKNRLIFQGKDMDVAGVLQKIAPFKCLDSSLTHALVEHVTVRQYLAGEYIFRQGDASLESLFVIISGSVEIIILDDQQREVVTAHRHEAEFLGETAVFSGETYLASARVAENASLILLPFPVFDRILSRHAEFSSQFSKIMTSRIRDIYHAQMTGQHSVYTMDQPVHTRVANLMSAPAVTGLPDDDVAELASIMTTKNVSSVIIVDNHGRPIGIITESDLVRKVVAAGSRENSLRAVDIMSGNLFTVTPEAFYYEALLLMVGNGIKHLVVVSDETLVGMITVRDMMITRGTTALTVVKSIEQQTEIEALATASEKTDKVLQGLEAEGASSRDTLQVMTEIYDRLTRKIIYFSEKEMIDEGYGPPPVAYSWISMGSSGRQEQFVKTDQDNGIIYDSVSEDEADEVARYFLRLGEKVVQGLLRCGFALCPGDIMASNPVWCRSLDGWTMTVKKWTEELQPENVRMMTVFLDFRHIYGDQSLCERVWTFVTECFHKSPTMLHFLAQDDLSHRVPLNFFKQIITERSGDTRGLVNLKASACVHLVDGVRILALREGILATNTTQRLKELVIREAFSQDDAESFISAYETLMMFRIRQSLLQLNRDKQPDNYLNPEQLTKREKAALREAFITADRLQVLISHAF